MEKNCASAASSQLKKRLLSIYDILKMDELVRDLTNALDEEPSSEYFSTCRGQQKHCEVGDFLSDSHQPPTAPGGCCHSASACSKKTNHAPKKRRGGKKWRDRIFAKLEAGDISESSESSLDEALKEYMESVAILSDSEDSVSQIATPAGSCNVAQKQTVGTTAALVANLPSPSLAVALAESDSLNEYISPVRPHRRKRRFKRMAVDLDPGELAQWSDYRRSRDFAARRAGGGGESGAAGVHSREGGAVPCRTDHDSLNKEFGNCCTYGMLFDTVPGKRKRGTRDRSFDFDCIIDDVTMTGMDGASATTNCGMIDDKDLSSLSSLSAESEGFYTNDEDREGDDEESDFFHESGPSTGVPSAVMNSWSENGEVTSGTNDADSASREPHTDRVLTETFPFISPKSRNNLQSKFYPKNKPGREMRSARRRLKDIRQVYSLSRFLHDRQQQWKDWCCTTGWQATTASNSSSNDTKRRRKTPPVTPTSDGCFGGHDTDAPPECARFLQNRMGRSYRRHCPGLEINKKKSTHKI